MLSAEVRYTLLPHRCKALLHLYDELFSKLHQRKPNYLD